MFWEAQVFGHQYYLNSFKAGPGLRLSTRKRLFLSQIQVFIPTFRDMYLLLWKILSLQVFAWHSPWSRVLRRLRDKLKTDGLLWGARTHNITPPPWLCGLARSCNKLKSLYFHYHNIYSQKNCRDDDFSLVASTYKVRWPYNHMVLLDHVTNLNILFALSQYLRPQQLADWWLYLEQHLAIKSYGRVIIWSCKITWQTKITKYPLPQCLWLPKLTGSGHTMRSSLQ